MSIRMFAQTFSAFLLGVLLVLVPFFSGADSFFGLPYPLAILLVPLVARHPDLSASPTS